MSTVTHEASSAIVERRSRGLVALTLAAGLLVAGAVIGAVGIDVVSMVGPDGKRHFCPLGSVNPLLVKDTPYVRGDTRYTDWRIECTWIRDL